MEKDERLTGAIQEDILTLLCYDDASCKTVRAAVGSPRLFESKMYREIAGVAIDFIDEFGKAIGDHLVNEFEEQLNSGDRLTAQRYEKTLKNLHTSRASVNSVYVLSRLQHFVRLQTMKSALVASVEAAEAGDIERVEVLWQAALKSQVVTFEGGSSLNDAEHALDFLDQIEQPLLTGIDALDKHNIGPSPGTVFLVVAPLKRGKTWFLMHLGKWAMLQRKVVVHISLEMSEAKTRGRYYQSIFAITKRDTNVTVPRFERNRDGTMADVTYEDIETLAYNDPDIREKLSHLVKRQLSRRAELRIKGFPSGSLTMAGLEAYLDGLERFEGIRPDVLIIDYPELMMLNSKDAGDKRAATGQLFVNLRGLAQKRNLALIAASQTNRAGIGKKVIDEQDLAEDVSKGFTVDTMVTYNQTAAEYKLGLARIFVAANRDDEGRQTILISQSYKMGAFCVDSVQVQTKYWEYIERRDRRQRDDEDEDGR